MRDIGVHNMTEKSETKTKGKVLRCPNCEASDAEFDIDAGGLRCLYCHEVFMSPKINQFGGFEELVGEVRESGAKDLRDDNYVITFKCPACGAEIVLDKNSKEISCHWCRHNLAVSEKIPNGEMPDLVLPFSVKRHTAFLAMKKFANQRKVFSIGRFHWGLKEKNLRAVYLPYALVDVRARVKLEGIASAMDANGRLGNIKVNRVFEMRIDDLTVEASRDKLKQDTIINTNHIINAILPFDTDEAVAWDPRYLKGYSCEKRDINIDELKTHLDYQIIEIAKAEASKKIKEYTNCIPSVYDIEYVGRKWKTAYFPVWLYSCRDIGFGKRRKIHYLALNGRTGEMMGSVPVGKITWNIIIFSPLVVSIILACFSSRLNMTRNQVFGLIVIALILHVVLTLVANSRTEEYINRDAYHDYTKETRISTVNDKDSSIVVKESLVPTSTKAYIRDEKGNKVEMYPNAEITRDWDEKKSFIEPEKFYRYTIAAVVAGLCIFVVGLILVSMIGRS